MVFRYHSTVVLHAELCSPLLRIAVTEHCVFILLLFSTSALIGGPIEYFQVFMCAIDFAESGILHPLPVDVHTFVAIVGLFSVFEGSQFSLKETYLAYHRSREVYWKNKASFRRFQYEKSSDDVLDIHARKLQQVRGQLTMLKLKNESERYPPW